MASLAPVVHALRAALDALRRGREPMDPAQERAFLQHATAISRRWLWAMGAGVAAMIIVFWPSDYLLFADDPAGFYTFAQWRIGVLAIDAVALLLVWRVAWVREHPNLLLFAAGTIGSAVGGTSLSALGGLDRPWFYPIYLVPFMSVAFPMPFVTRVLGTGLLALGWAGGFFIGRPELLEYPYLVAPVTFTACAVAVSSITGDIITGLTRSSFLDRAQLAHLNSRLEARIEEQMAELVRTGELKRFLPESVADRIVRGAIDPSHHHEREHMTVLFVDLVGYTPLSGLLPSETLSAVLNDYLREMSAAVAEHGGIVDKFIGDAVMALFGPPALAGVEAHAAGAVGAALSMRGRMEALDARWRAQGLPVGLNIRIGIASGEVSVGVFGSDERRTYTVLGTPVNVAARLQAAAEPGQILVSEPTWTPIRGRFLAEDRGPLSLKGIAEPVPAFQVLGTPSEVIRA